MPRQILFNARRGCDVLVWRAGQEVTQYTYFQQAGGQPLPAPAVEITYGLERILMTLQARLASHCLLVTTPQPVCLKHVLHMLAVKAHASFPAALRGAAGAGA